MILVTQVLKFIRFYQPPALRDRPSKMLCCYADKTSDRFKELEIYIHQAPHCEYNLTPGFCAVAVG